MLILIFVISLIITCTGIFVNYGEECLISIGSVMMFFSIIGLIIVSIIVVDGRFIDEKIAMYQEENKVIEEQMDDLVSLYMKYEQDTFSNLKGESSITLVSLYPELKSDELVKQQCDVYLSNNKTIKKLREKKISLKASKWWLYFGG